MPLLETLKLIGNHPLNRDRRLSAWSRWLRWQLRSRLFSGDHVIPWINDTQLRMRSGETGLTGNLYCGLHEFHDMAFLLHALRAETDLFVDVGANAGAYTVLAAGACAARVIAVEPVPSTFARLSGNIRLNKLDAKVDALNVGLSRETGSLRFTTGLDCINHVLTEGEDNGESVVEVPVSTLADVLGDRSPRFIKIDVEGYELPVLEGGRSVLANESLLGMIMETNHSGDRYGFSQQAVLDLLNEYGFEPMGYDPFTRTLSTITGSHNPQGNTIFLRDAVAVQARLNSAPAFSVNGVTV